MKPSLKSSVLNVLYETKSKTQVLSAKDKAFLKKCIKGAYFVNPKTGLIDVKGSVKLSNQNLTSIPYKFGNVSENFYCSVNKLTSLIGCPRTIGGDFICDTNQLTSLAGCPRTVERSFDCSNNQLTSLAGCPQTVGWDLDVTNNKIETLKWLPKCQNQSEVIKEIRKQIRAYLIDLGFDPKDKENFAAMMKAQEKL